MKYEIRLLGKGLDRAAFSCGEPALDEYLKKYATQDMRNRTAACYALAEASSPQIIGYYTLSTTSIELADIPSEYRRKLPKYPHVPAALLGRLAIDSRFQGQSIGDVLLGDALLRTLRLSAEIAINMVVVDALHEKAAAYYERREFARFSDVSLRLFMPVAKIRDAFPPESTPQRDPHA